jgi:hypothetical protein
MKTTDPVEHAARHGDEQDKYNDLIQAAEDVARADFMAQAKRADANAVCIWASTVTDYSNTAGVGSVDKLPQRNRTFTEVCADSLDLGNGPSTSELVQVLLNAASGLPSTQVFAQALLERMAMQHARFEVRV